MSKWTKVFNKPKVIDWYHYIDDTLTKPIVVGRTDLAELSRLKSYKTATITPATAQQAAEFYGRLKLLEKKDG
jgi:hypothetical protein